MLIDAGLLWAFIAACLAVYILPGPDMAYIADHAMRSGRSAGLLAAAGTVIGICVQASAAALGVSAIFKISPIAFEAVRWIGVGYLAYLGVRLLMSNTPESTAHPALAPSAARIVLQGAAINILNPKVALFFLAFLPQFAHMERGHLFGQLAVLGGIFTGGAIIWCSFMALGFAYLGARLQRSSGFQKWQSRLTGTAFIGFAGVLAFSDISGRR